MTLVADIAGRSMVFEILYATTQDYVDHWPNTAWLQQYRPRASCWGEPAAAAAAAATGTATTGVTAACVLDPEPSHQEGAVAHRA